MSENNSIKETVIRKKIVGTFLPEFAIGYGKKEESLIFDDNESGTEEKYWRGYFTSRNEFLFIDVTNVET